ncbi:polyprenyl synthetase [Nonlabens spongiae]|uniref:Polyprenyl synthetase n=1 Tax=Nonlabens spongiae TaxID=331648 RepID=A0A1W6MKR7_9FLAO|nr:polyprenyl synthetase family protein [Nonlabens spongiae]ARN78201.1 polyprenyl synthetase [Nonlabens spongiae]
MDLLSDLKSQFLEALKQRTSHAEPATLYDPVHYILDLGGKRLRPLLSLMAAEMYGAKSNDAMGCAIAVEVFHNFTLLHDDIMDAADLRRGKETVHKKWDVNTGILSGDAMLIMAYQQLDEYEGTQFKELTQLLSRTALEVCEGQQYDVDFETRDDVTIDEYLLMIKLKTSVLLGCSLQMGAIIAGASKEQQQFIYDYGIYLGIAFQLMDDYLDAFGDPETFGKEVGGDIRENKKTYLYLKSLEHSQSNESLKKWFALDQNTLSEMEMSDKKEKVKTLFQQSGGAQATLDAIIDYTEKALNTITQLEISDENKTFLKRFSLQLMNRIS